MPTTNSFHQLQDLIKSVTGKIFVLCDENTYFHCYEQLIQNIEVPVYPIIIRPGENEKNLQTCTYIWNILMAENADKNAILVNLGGGVITDVGGFVAATYKRGINYINVPTSLLAMVDAASGGKSGVNFNHLKNIIGVIYPPQLVVIHEAFLKTLSPQHLKNGFVEMLKHALLSNENDLNQIINCGIINNYINTNTILHSLSIKNKIVAQDPLEQGPRKVLNLGHTLGHAIESVAMQIGANILHGEAVAVGIIIMLELSVLKLNFDPVKAQKIIDFIYLNYSVPNWTKEHKSSLIKATLQDKKNSHNQIKMVLLEDIGQAVYDIHCHTDEIEAAIMSLKLS